MLFNDNVIIEMKTMNCGKPAIKTLESRAAISSLGEETQFDLKLQNRDLHMARFDITEGCIIRHESGVYRCTGPAFKIGRPHHLVVYTKQL